MRGGEGRGCCRHVIWGDRVHEELQVFLTKLEILEAFFIKAVDIQLSWDPFIDSRFVIREETK
jgi:hypothetical protein